MASWPFTKESQVYILKCPNCLNELRFEAFYCGSQLYWFCPDCGYRQDFLLIPATRSTLI